MSVKQTMVIVGASLAGAKAAETLRDEGFDGRVVLVGDEAERPYERPPLSKDYLRGEAGREQGLRPRRGLLRRARHRASHRRCRGRAGSTSRRARSCSPTASACRYDRLLLATGAEPRRLSVPGADLDGVLYLRTLADSDALRARLEAGGRVVVIGAGWIGAEVAGLGAPEGPRGHPRRDGRGPARAGARRRGRRASSATSTPTTASASLRGAGVEAFEGDGRVERVRTGRRAAIDCDFVVVGVGVRAAHRARRACGPRRRQRHPRRRAPRDERPGRLRRRRRRERATTPSTGRASASSTGPTPCNQGPAAARGMLGERRRLRPPAVLLLRPVRRRHGVLGLRRRLGPRSSSAATRPAASSSPSGSATDASSRA